jgi:hypothetical protein
MTSASYYYQMGNVIDMKLSQSDHIKQLTLNIHTVGAALGPGQTDPINQMIPLTDTRFGINSKQDMEISKKMIPLTE